LTSIFRTHRIPGEESILRKESRPRPFIND
jgi:hypothetical protein